MRLLVKNANRFDTRTMEFTGDTSIVAEDGVIVAIGELKRGGVRHFGELRHDAVQVFA